MGLHASFRFQIKYMEASSTQPVSSNSPHETRLLVVWLQALCINFDQVYLCIGLLS